MAARRRIVVDTDPGQDDAVALLIALASPELDVAAITTVAGNVPLDLTTRNALMMVELADRRDVPVFAGCSRPMVRPLRTAEYVHGPTGIDGVDRPEPELEPRDSHAVDALIELLGAGGVTVCTLGPQTNLAMAMVKAPEIVAGIDEIVMMGGGFFEGGNVTPAAEFNIYVDPHAAHVVFTSGVPITMMPLDVTHQALTSDERVRRFRELGTAAGTAVAGMLDFFDRYDEAKYGTDGAPLHDPCVIAYLLQPDLFAGRRCHVAIENHSEATMGMTLVDWWGVTGNEPNAMVMNQIDDGRFYDLLVERIGRLS
ncbi:MAG TPA: nucleoside hydrolase [Acidimicrobiia bacterium]|jgi:purine nucleosidase|nr:nucleoside hydrolase [Acidimicrobiia bacterium]